MIRLFKTHFMKTVSFLLLIATFSFAHTNAQELNCVNYQFYNADYDVIKVRNQPANDELIITTPTTNPVQLIVSEDSYALFPKQTHFPNTGVPAGLKVVLTNSTAKEVNLPSINGKTRITRQALINNKWVDVRSYDRTPNRVCGTTYLSKNTIKANSSLLFALPCIEGDIHTKYRLVLYLKDYRKTIYSNAFDGYISRELIY